MEVLLAPDQVIWIAAVALLFCYPLVVVVHELGHLLPTLLLTRGPVRLFLGCYAPPEALYWHLRMGRLQVWVHWGRFIGGQCSVADWPELTRGQQLFIVLAGPLLPVLFFGGLYWAFVASAVHVAAQVAALSVWLFSVASMFYNLRPSKQLRFMADGELQLSDGDLVRSLWRDEQMDQNPYVQEAQQALYKLDHQQWAEGQAIIEGMIAKRVFWPQLLDKLVDACLRQNKLELAKSYARLSGDVFHASHYGWSSMAAVRLAEGKYELAIDAATNAILIAPDSADAFYRRAVAYSANKAFDKALADYEMLMHLDDQHPGSYAGRAAMLYFVQRTAEMPDAIALAQSKQPAEATEYAGYVALAQGLYAFAQKDYATAAKHLRQAIALHPGIPHALQYQHKAELELMFPEG